ncbi:MAG TPA: hypothetical protein VK509_01660 [Polyangiales bacterium]|nr:hypothetical protein [Polyangiales bacterium]
MNQPNHVLLTQPRPSLVTVAHVVYALHAVSLAIGAWTAATVVGSFLFGWPSILAVVLNYALRSDTRGTWLESHFRWQIRTFWWAVACAAAIALISAILALVLIGFITWPVGFFLLGVWAIVRVARGWLRLRDGQPIDG